MTRKTLFTVLIVLQVVFLLAVAGSYYGIDQFGKEIRLKTAPVDPSDLFYGDYVTLNYEISSIDPSLWKGANKPEPGDVVYVVLEPKGNLYKAVAAYPTSPEVADGQIVLKGTNDYFWDSQTMRIRYGIERYYVPENTGKAIEDKTRKGNAIVVLKIAPWGQMKVTSLELP